MEIMIRAYSERRREEKADLNTESRQVSSSSSPTGCSSIIASTLPPTQEPNSCDDDYYYHCPYLNAKESATSAVAPSSSAAVAVVDSGIKKNAPANTMTTALVNTMRRPQSNQDTTQLHGMSHGQQAKESKYTLEGGHLFNIFDDDSDGDDDEDFITLFSTITSQ
uniref:Uncharacterized protein n=1 Tax=Odontella aurita TaxID=265563 RepID=A0A7S4ITA2_9STRA|mmetsp:Transcript_29958/g.89119  ORF Transcript_29958/g.89119 Transcript_29958/m.89119 type:complete len:165 (+) Transcript_29958:220-714(+)